VKGPAGNGSKALIHQRRTTVDESRHLGAVLRSPIGHGCDVGFVVLANVCGVRAGDGAPIAHPGDSYRRVETAGEGDTDTLSDR